MNRNDFCMQKVSSPLQWFRIYCLYRISFPRSERKPFAIIRSMQRKGKTDVWYVRRHGRFAGFATTINGGGLILLDYLAVTKSMRGKSVGSRVLKEMKKIYGGKGIFVEIESPFEAAPDQAERVRRKKFYMAGGMQPAQVMASVFGVQMELLCWNCSLDFSMYRAFYHDNYNAWAAEHILEAEYPRHTGG